MKSLVQTNKCNRSDRKFIQAITFAARFSLAASRFQLRPIADRASDRTTVGRSRLQLQHVGAASRRSCQ
jgi:hypothetical protein